MHSSFLPRVRAGLVLLLATAAFPAAALDESFFTVYFGRISLLDTWHDVLLEPYKDEYVDSYLVAAAWSHAYRERMDGALRFEYEVNAAYNFGLQDHWELNVAPIGLRWQRFPWSARM